MCNLDILDTIDANKTEILIYIIIFTTRSITIYMYEASLDFVIDPKF